MIGKIAVVGASIATMALITVVPTEIVATANADVNSFIYELETSPYADFYGPKINFIQLGYAACQDYYAGNSFNEMVTDLDLYSGSQFDYAASAVIVSAAISNLC
jgi:hypothetical protein